MPLCTEVGLGSGDIALNADPAPPKWTQQPPHTFRPMSFVAVNSWTHQDATWYGGRPKSRPHCVRWGPSTPSKKGKAPKFSAGWIKVPLGSEVDLGPGHTVLDGDPAPPSLPPIGAQQPPHFSARLLWPNACMDQAATWYKVSSAQATLLDGNPAPPTERGTAAPHFSAHVYCGQTAGWIKMPLGTNVGLGPGDIVLDGKPAPPRERGTAAPTPLFGPCLSWPIGRPSQQLLSSCYNVLSGCWCVDLTKYCF